MSGELLKMMTGTDIVGVPYRTNFMPDVLSGQVQAGFPAGAPALGFIKSGKVRALGVTSAIRMEALPNVPAIAEFVPGYEGSGWLGICAPKGTPGGIVDRVNRDINAVIADAAIKAHLIELGAEPVQMTPAQLGTLIAEAAQKWAKVIKFANIKPE
jgi:tripartite-type tricarboxylate transporter receptor subunit TctC